MVQEFIKVSHDQIIYNCDLVYLLQCNEFVKIGRTGNMIARLQNYKSSNPMQMYIIGLISGGAKEEKALQKMFDHLWVKGEWFKYDQEIVQYFTDFEVISLENLQEKLIRQQYMTNPPTGRSKLLYQKRIGL